MHIEYLTGFGNYFESEAIPGSLVKGRNSPQKVPLGLFAEQISGSAFTIARHLNLHSWFYRIRPSVLHGEFNLIAHPKLINSFDEVITPPTQMRWDPVPYPTEKLNFIESLMCIAGNNGAAIYLYAFNKSMETEYFYNADGDMLIVPQEGHLLLRTEFGQLEISPKEIAVIQRGIKFQVILLSGKARGFVCENSKAPFRLPELGVIGANGLANPRDFQMPNAAYEEKTGNFKLLTKFQKRLWEAHIEHSPLDVVAWHGNYVPYKYDLTKFNTINSVSFDHPDPSIFTVLTSGSEVPGIANIDFVIFPPRWCVTTDTFRPPYYHRNIMNEYMGLIEGTYDAKDKGFLPGGSSLHNCMSAHGPDFDAFKKATTSKLEPEYYDNTFAFMFESSQIWQLTKFGLNAEFRQNDYLDCWKNLNLEAKKIVS